MFNNVGARVVLAVNDVCKIPVCSLTVGQTSLQLADGQHAVIDRRLPQPKSSVIADCGADGE